MPLLPPPKPKMDPRDADAIMLYLDGLVWQSYEQSTVPRDAAQRNYNLWLGNHWTEVAPNDTQRYVYNRIKTILCSHVAIQNGTRAKVTFLPRNSGKQGKCFVRTNVLASLSKTDPDISQLLATIPPECVAPVPEPLPRDVYEHLQAAIEQGELLTEEAMAQRLPAPKVIPPELVIEVNDTTTASAVQSLFDAQWDACNADYLVVTDGLYNGIVGWSNMHYRWDAMVEKHLLDNCPFQQVFMDPTKTDISLAATAVYDAIYCEEQAAAEYPEFRDVIDQTFTVTKPMLAGSYVYAPASVYWNFTLRQKFGVIRFAYVRNQPYPMNPQEALDRGLIVQGYPAPKESPDATQAAEPAGGEPATRSDSIDQTAEPGGDAGAGDGNADGGSESSADAGGRSDLAAQSPGEAGEDAQGGPVAQPTAYLLVKNGKPAHEVKPWGPDWPMRRGIREMIAIGSKLVADREYAGTDIPITHNVNFPRMNSPLGQGTPEDLELLNMAINEVLTGLVEHMRQESYGTTIVANALELANKNISKQAFKRAGTMLTAPDDQTRELDKLMHTLEPPKSSDDVWRFLAQLLDLIDKQGDMAQVLQGQVSNLSGEAIGKLQGAAQNSILYRAMRAETMLKYLANLMLGGLRQMSVEAMCEAVPEYEPYIWAAFKDYFVRGLQYDLHVEVSAGGAAAKQMRNRQITEASQTGAPVSPQTRLEALDLDPDKEMQQTKEWQAQSQPPAASVQAQQGPPSVAPPAPTQ